MAVFARFRGFVYEALSYLILKENDRLILCTLSLKTFRSFIWLFTAQLESVVFVFWYFIFARRI